MESGVATVTLTEVETEISRLREETLHLKAKLVTIGGWRRVFWRRITTEVKADLYDRMVAIDHLLIIHTKMFEEQRGVK